MSQFQVPQFIDTEPKIVGPLTLRQFIYIGVAGLLIFMLFFVLKAFFFFIAAALVGVIALAFAFGRYNGRPFTVFIKNALLYLWQPKLYLWQRKAAITDTTTPALSKIQITSNSSESKLKSMWINLTTKRPSGPMKKL